MIECPSSADNYISYFDSWGSGGRQFLDHYHCLIAKKHQGLLYERRERCWDGMRSTRCVRYFDVEHIILPYRGFGYDVQLEAPGLDVSWIRSKATRYLIIHPIGDVSSSTPQHILTLCISRRFGVLHDTHSDRNFHSISSGDHKMGPSHRHT
jgi:hypothetical protein